MKLRHLIAAAPVAVLVLTGCSNSDADTTASPSTAPSVASDVVDAAVKEMCSQVAVFIDSSAQAAQAAGQPFDRAAKGEEFLTLLKSSSGAWVGAYNAQAEAAGQPQLDPATATWEDMPADSRDMIERSVQAGVSGTC
ncbi:hypothetical protein [Prescottella agglutinans]|uniref:Outer membrane murein-binding lipoprotein Lpp n=1 Tax=Prescottella agglutinans TaxID=1644129 RepID=A0ABT6M4K1_9NOCA|nr:hypothetical protein [Prescottella agglutinans]MDH6278825.1 outer membrane murein-binding lipoprotein Lpp [Prescottella agglutinans]